MASDPIRFGKYLLVEKIASGGMAEVYKAVATGTDGKQYALAIKRILPQYSSDQEFISLLIDEAKLMVMLNHPNIVPIIEFGKIDDSYFIAMGYVDGITLKELFRLVTNRHEYFPIEIAIHLVREIGSGLAYAHRRVDQVGNPLSIVHRDISPANILISHDGEVKIADFGISKAANQSHRTQAGIIRGKTGYMSPEQTRANSPIDQRSDIYALGIMFYEVLTSQRLYKLKSIPEALKTIRLGKIPSVHEYRSGIPVALEKILLKVLAVNPKDRYQRAEEFVDALDEFLIRWSPQGRPIRVTYTDLCKYLSNYLEQKDVSKIKREEGTPIRANHLSVVAPSTLSESVDGEVQEAFREEATRSETFAANPRFELSQGETVAPPKTVVTRDFIWSKSWWRDRPRALWIASALVLGAAILGVRHWIGPSTGTKPVFVEVTPTPKKPMPKATPTQQKPKTNIFRVSSVPSGASVFLNEEKLDDVTPIKLPPQKLGEPIKIRLELEGYEPVEKTLQSSAVNPAQETFLLVKEEKISGNVGPNVGPPPKLGASPGKLSMNTTPWSYVYIDGKKEAHTTPLFDIEISPGRHRIRCMNQDFGIKPYVFTIRVKSDETKYCLVDFKKKSKIKHKCETRK